MGWFQKCVPGISPHGVIPWAYQRAHQSLCQKHAGGLLSVPFTTNVFLSLYLTGLAHCLAVSRCLDMASDLKQDNSSTRETSKGAADAKADRHKAVFQNAHVQTEQDASIYEDDLGVCRTLINNPVIVLCVLYGNIGALMYGFDNISLSLCLDMPAFV